MSDVTTTPPKAEEVLADRTEARARTFVLQLAWLLPCLLVFVFFFQANFRGLHLVEAMDAAQLARHISQGEGYTTSFLRPSALQAGTPAAAQPEVMHAPLYPMVLAVAFNLLGEADRTVGLVATLCGMLTALLAYLIARRLLDTTAAGLAAVFVSLNVGFLTRGVEGLNLSLIALLTTLVGYLLVRHGGRVRESAWCGVACGLLYLAEYAMLPVVVLVMLAVGLGQASRRWTHVIVCLLGFLLLAGPWTLRDWRLSGGPFTTPRAREIATYTDTYPQTGLYRMSPEGLPSSLAYVKEHPRQVVKKALRNLDGFQPMIPGILEGALLLLLGVALLVEMRRGEARRLRWAMFGGAGLVVVSLAIGRPSLEILSGFLGVAAALSAVGLLHLVRARKLSPRGYTALLACVVALAAFELLMTVALRTTPENPDREGLKYMQKTLPKEALVVTDEPWAVAWYADRPALWIPYESAPDRRQPLTQEVVDATRQPGFLALEKLGFKPTAIYLTSHLPSHAEREEMSRWVLLRDIVGGQLREKQPWAPPGWEVTNTFAPAEMLLQRTAPVAPAS